MSAPLNLLDLIFRGRAPRHICDIGAADGEDTAIYANHFREARVIAFEPVCESVDQLRARIRAHGIQDRVEVRQIALGRVQGRNTPFFVSDSDATRSGHHRLSSSLLAPRLHKEFHPWCTFRSEVVDVETLDDSVESVDFIHLDVQGAELDVLAGGQHVLQQTRAVWLEVSNVEMYLNQPLREDIEVFMQRRGFRLCFDALRGAPQGDQLWARS